MYPGRPISRETQHRAAVPEGSPTNGRRLDGGRLVRAIDRRHDRESPGRRDTVRSISGAALAPGLAAGVAGLAVFLVLHAVWIVPIWSVTALGLVVAVLGGAAVSWAYLQVEPHLPGGTVRRWLAVAGGAALVLSPSLVVAWAGTPYFTVVDGSRVPTAERSVVAARFVVEFLVVTTLSGALVGWLVTHTRRGTVVVAVAAFAFAIGPGHNLPFFDVVTAPATARTAVLLTLTPIVVASAVFVAVDALLSRSGRSPDEVLNPRS